MPRPRTYRSSKGVDAVGSGWSYSQFVIAIAAAIVFGVFCFTVGYMIAIRERPISLNDKLAANTESVSPREEESPKPNGTSQENDSSSSPTEKEPRITPPPPSERRVERPDLRPVDLAPLATPGATDTPMVVTKLPVPTAPSADETTETPSTATDAPKLPESSARPADTAAVDTVQKPPSPAVKPPERATPTTEAPKPKPAPPRVAKGSWGIQVAFFDGKDRKKQAETVKQRLKSGSDQSADLVISADDKEYRVVIGGFDTRDAAKVACEKLKLKTGFADAWVKRFP